MIKETITLEMDFRVLSALFITFLIPTVLYHDKEKYNINDAFYLIGGIFFLSLSFYYPLRFSSICLYPIVYRCG